MHLYFLNFKLVPSQYFSKSDNRFYQYAVDSSFLRNCGMGILVMLFWIVSLCILMLVSKYI